MIGKSRQIQSPRQFEIAIAKNFKWNMIASHKLTRALNLPTFTYQSGSESLVLTKRLALILDKEKIQKVFYPVFPPDKNAQTVLDWIQQNK